MIKARIEKVKKQLEWVLSPETEKELEWISEAFDSDSLKDFDVLNFSEVEKFINMEYNKWLNRSDK